MSRNTRLFWLLLIMLLAATFRIYHIDLQSLWIDEGFTWNFTQYDNPMLILRQDVHPPLYFFAMRLWVQIAGTSVVAMRFFSVLPSVLSVAVVYQIAREIEKNRRIETVMPLIAALLMALTDAEISLAQEVRGYTWHVLFACLSMWGFLRWIRNDKLSARWLWMLSTIALVYTFYLGAFVGVAQGIYALLFLSSVRAQYIAPLHHEFNEGEHKISPEFGGGGAKRRRGLINLLKNRIGTKRLEAVIVLMLCALVVMPWLLATAGQQAENISRGEVILPQDYGFWLKDFRGQFFGQQWALMLGLFVFGLIIVRYDGGRLRISLDKYSILLLLWFGVPLLLFLIGNSKVPLYQPRRVTQIVPAIVLLTAFGIGNLPRGLARWFTIIVILIYSVVHVDFGRFKQPWRQMVADTVAYIAPDMPIFFELGGDDYAPRYHYAEALPNSYDFLLDRPDVPAPDDNVLIGLTTWRHLEPTNYQISLPSILDSLDHLWLFYWSSDVGALNWLNSFGHQRTATFTVDFNPDVYLYRYDRLPDDPVATFQNGMVLEYGEAHESLLVDLVWTTENPLDTQYTTSAFLLNQDGQLVAQLDSQPFLNQRPTLSWAIDEAIYDPKIMQLANGDSLPAGTYSVGVVVYLSDDSSIRVLTDSGDDKVMLGTLTLE